MLSSFSRTDPVPFPCVLSALVQFGKPAASAEQIDIQHQFVYGTDAQFLIDAPVVLSHRAHADAGEVRDLGYFMPFYIIP
jgi:hypothetical protein